MAETNHGGTWQADQGVWTCHDSEKGESWAGKFQEDPFHPTTCEPGTLLDAVDSMGMKKQNKTTMNGEEIWPGDFWDPMGFTIL